MRAAVEQTPERCTCFSAAGGSCRLASRGLANDFVDTRFPQCVERERKQRWREKEDARAREREKARERARIRELELADEKREKASARAKAIVKRPCGALIERRQRGAHVRRSAEQR